MGDTSWARVKEIVGEAAELAGEARAGVLDRRCAGDADLRRQVEELLAAHDVENSSASGPTIDPGVSGSAGAGSEGGEHRAGEVIGRYRLLEKIGEGGFGSVFVAEQTEPIRRRVALKIVKLGMDTASVVARFEAERQALAIMDHPHIARVFDAGATPTGRPYFVMELVKGRPIHEYCEEEGVSIRERVELMMLVCAAVQHAHQKGIIHRDLKPSNVLVTLSDGRASPKVIDFGIAKATGGSLGDRPAYTEFRQLIGTPEYMSPEQAAGSLDVDTRTDVYSLGVILYQLLTGSTPLDPQRLRSAAFDEVRRIIREEEPVKPSTRLASEQRAAGGASSGSAASARGGLARTRQHQVRGELDWIVMRALEKSPSRRYDSPERLGADLAQYLRGEPIAAGPPTASYRIRKFVSRQRGLVATAGVLVVAAGVGVAGLATGLVRASRERDAAIEAKENESKARDRAARAARQLQAADQFMKDVLSNARPSGLTGNPITVSEVLDDAAVRLETGSLRNEPEVQAKVRLSLAQSYRSIGSTDRARAHAERARELAAGFGDGRNTTAAAALVELALLANDVGDIDGGLRLAQSGVDMLRELGAQTTLEYFTALQCLGGIRLGSSDREGGEAVVRESIEVANRLFGEHSAEAAEARAFLASRIHDRAENEAELRRVVEDYRTALGPNHPSVGNALLTLGIHLHMTRRYEEAERVYAEALELAQRTFGPSHPTTFLATDFYGWVAYSAGNFDAAVERRRRVVEIAERCFGTWSARRGTCLNSLGLAAQAQGDIPLAFESFLEAVEVMDRAEHPSDVDYYTAIANMATAAWELGEVERAEQEARRVLAAPEKVRPLIRGSYGRSMMLVGEALARRSDFAGGEPALLEGYELIEQGRQSSNRIGALFLASSAIARFYEQWNAADPSPERAASAAAWAARRDEMRGNVDWESAGMRRFKER
ncbi:MAG: protein kinase [Phycisphaerales bacterium]